MHLICVFLLNEDVELWIKLLCLLISPLTGPSSIKTFSESIRYNGQVICDNTNSRWKIITHGKFSRWKSITSEIHSGNFSLINRSNFFPSNKRTAILFCMNHILFYWINDCKPQHNELLSSSAPEYDSIMGIAMINVTSGNDLPPGQAFHLTPIHCFSNILLFHGLLLLFMYNSTMLTPTHIRLQRESS